MEDKSNLLLYRNIQLDFFKKVFYGEISPHQKLLPERKLAKELSISRGTVRKALENFAKEGYIQKVQGKGNIYTPQFNSSLSMPEIIAVLVPVNNPFFLSYYRAFETIAEKSGCLVVIKQVDNCNLNNLEMVLFSLFLKGIKDIVFWPYDTLLDYTYIERLCGLGMKVVFFDNIQNFKYCDYVSLDNKDAIENLYFHLQKLGSKKIAYIGWKTNLVSSNIQRERAFREIKHEADKIITIPWIKEENTYLQIQEQLKDQLIGNESGIDGFLCSNGNLGISTKKYLNKIGMGKIAVCSIDNFTKSEELKLTVYEQPFKRMAEKTFHLIIKRHHDAEKWKSSICYLKGKLIIR
jgi:DNA-binding LacI/PurR family transcriptional regulator